MNTRQNDRETLLLRKNPAAPVAGNKKQKSLSMHEGVPVWYDCCSCEAEPYWMAQADEPPDKNP